MDNLLAVVLAGGEGVRLMPLTSGRSKAAVPFGGKYRLIDFTLSNCINSGIRQIYVLTQYRSQSLIRHVQEGWGISSAGLGEFIYSVPAQQTMGRDWYRGTADALRQNIDLVTRKHHDNIIVLSGDHVYKMDYDQMLQFHRENSADLTVAAIRTTKGHASDALGVMETSRESRITGFSEKPHYPAEDGDHLVLSSMGVYLFRAEVLKRVLAETSEDDFGSEVIPGMLGSARVFAYDYQAKNSIEDYVFEVKDGRRQKVLAKPTRDSSYWHDVGTIDSYYRASMELIGLEPGLNLYGENWQFRTYQNQLPPTKYVLGVNVQDCLICQGCIISGGTVLSSILSPGVVVEKGALVEESILFQGASIEPGVRVRRAIIDKDVKVRAGVSLGYDLEADRRRGCTVSDSGIVVVPKGLELD
jgi:glucose-1-phosphate adenylyltransferase